MLYPLKFYPIYKEKLWGGQKIAKKLKAKNIPSHCGEAWMISGLKEDLSVVSNGYLKENNIQELLEIYMADLIGKKNYERFGNEFPLLIKYIDASQQLSVQVHPNNEIAKKRHHAYGKTEMWYVIEAENDASIITGFNRELSKHDFVEHLNNNNILELLNIEKNIRSGDVFYIPAGRIHSIGKGIFLAEIQQISDITYRIFDWERKGLDGKQRELHWELAIDAIDYEYFSSYKTPYEKKKNVTNKVINSPYFTTNYIPFNKPVSRSFFEEDSFVIYMAISGDFTIDYEGKKEHIFQGETLLIPAEIPNFKLIPDDHSVEVLEIYINNEN